MSDKQRLSTGWIWGAFQRMVTYEIYTWLVALSKTLASVSLTVQHFSLIGITRAAITRIPSSYSSWTRASKSSEYDFSQIFFDHVSARRILFSSKLAPASTKSSSGRQTQLSGPSKRPLIRYPSFLQNHRDVICKMNNITSLYSSTPTSGSSRFSYPSAPSAASLQSSSPATSIRSASQPHPPSLQQQLFGSSAQATSGILDRPLNRTRGAEVSLNAFAFLLAEIVSYSQSRVDSVTDLERR